MSEEAKREYQRQYMAKRRVRPAAEPVRPGLVEPDSVRPEHPAGGDVRPATDRRQWLRDRLDAYRAEYLEVSRQQDRYPGRLSAINREREPLFAELAKLEAGMPASQQYWMPVRFSQQAAMPKA